MTPSGEATDGLTGPFRDHTLGLPSGSYLYMEADGRSQGDKARFVSPQFRTQDGEGRKCNLRLYYYMYGSEMNQFRIVAAIVYNNGTNAEEEASLSSLPAIKFEKFLNQLIAFDSSLDCLTLLASTGTG